MEDSTMKCDTEVNPMCQHAYAGDKKTAVRNDVLNLLFNDMSN